jgi:tetratricopeptide (TPR) repeat protein
MNCSQALTAAFAAALLSASQANSATKPEFFVAKLENGVSVGFALVRSGADQPGNDLGEVIFPRSSGLSRVLYDETAGTYFGYRLEVSSSDRRLKVTILPLNGDIAHELNSRAACAGCKSPKPLPGALSRVPAPLTVADGAVVTIELLVNQATGEKIVDVVKLALQPFEAEAMRTPAEHVLDALKTTQRADILAARGDYDAAAGEYRRALEQNPNDPTVRNKLAICYQQVNQPGRAEEQYRQALRINPNYAEAWNNLGSLAHSNGNYKQAIKHYQKAVSLRPNFATAYRNLGAADFALGQIEDGLAAWDAAYRIDPSVLNASAGSSVAGGGLEPGEQYFYFAKICAKKGQIDNALLFLKQAQTASFKDWKRVANDTDFAAVVHDPRYLELTGAKK